MNSPLDVNQGQRYTALGKTIQCSIPDPLQLRKGLHRRNQAEVKNKGQRTPRQLWEGSNREVSDSRACMGNHHPIKWEDTSVVEQVRRSKELMLKEALHIQLMPSEERFNRDVGIELPDCLDCDTGDPEGRGQCPSTCVLRPHVPLTCMLYISSLIRRTCLTFALRTTRVTSRDVENIFYRVQLVTR